MVKYYTWGHGIHRRLIKPERNVSAWVGEAKYMYLAVDITWEL